ncbi:MAG: TraR/DksA family transcriptional regulator [Phycisphaerae bacterium]
MLLEKRALLVRDMRTMSDEALNRNRQESSGNLSSMPIHMADLGTDNYEQEFTLGLIESERALLRDIDEALQRISNGTYGICAATGRAIGKARLNAQPWTKYSYEYVLALEKGGRRT